MGQRVPPEMIRVPGGTFTSAIRAGAPDKRITLTDFRLARTQTTNTEYARFCTDTGQGMGLHTPGWGLSDENPVVNVSWYAAIDYANWMSTRAGLSPAYVIDKDRDDPDNENPYDHLKWTVRVDWRADGFRLPTEAEWEYAARGGQNGLGFRFAGSDDLDEVGWFAGNSGGRAHDVAAKRPNELMLHDMSGNVWEWCWDWYEDAPAGSDGDPRGSDGGTFRVVRGGSWYVSDDLCLVENRNYANPHLIHNNYGLRLAQSL
jgi:sulfatase modifying factor 1